MFTVLLFLMHCHMHIVTLNEYFLMHPQVLEHGITSHRWDASHIKRCRYGWSCTLNFLFWPMFTVTTSVLHCHNYRKCLMTKKSNQQLLLREFPSLSAAQHELFFIYLPDSVIYRRAIYFSHPSISALYNLWREKSVRLGFHSALHPIEHATQCAVL